MYYMAMKLRPLACLIPLCVSMLSAAPVDDAKLLMEQKRVPEAIPLLEAALKQNAKDWKALQLLGSCRLQVQDFEGAVTALEESATVQPEDSRTQTLLANAYFVQAARKSSMGMARRGKAAIEKALKLDPKNEEALMTAIGFYGEAPFFVGGSSSRAEELTTQLAAVNPGRALLARTGKLAKDKKFDEALSLCDAYLAKAPADYSALYELGRLCGMADKRHDDGVKALRECLSKTPPTGAPGHDGANFRLGVLFKQKGDKALSEQFLDEALKLSGNNPEMVKRVAKVRG